MTMDHGNNHLFIWPGVNKWSVELWQHINNPLHIIKIINIKIITLLEAFLANVYRGGGGGPIFVRIPQRFSRLTSFLTIIMVKDTLLEVFLNLEEMLHIWPWSSSPSPSSWPKTWSSSSLWNERHLVGSILEEMLWRLLSISCCYSSHHLLRLVLNDDHD